MWERDDEPGSDEEVFGFDPQTEWRTKDGQLLLLRRMKESHLKNTIRYLKRTGRADEFADSIQAMENELEFRSETVAV
jgi:hypothetical protein